MTCSHHPRTTTPTPLPAPSSPLLPYISHPHSPSSSLSPSVAFCTASLRPSCTCLRTLLSVVSLETLHLVCVGQAVNPQTLQLSNGNPVGRSLQLSPASADEEQFPYHYKRIPNDGVIDPDWPDDKASIGSVGCLPSCQEGLDIAAKKVVSAVARLGFVVSECRAASRADSVVRTGSRLSVPKTRRA